MEQIAKILLLKVAITVHSTGFWSVIYSVHRHYRFHKCDYNVTARGRDDDYKQITAALLLATHWHLRHRPPPLFFPISFRLANEERDFGWCWWSWLVFASHALCTCTMLFIYHSIFSLEAPCDFDVKIQFSKTLLDVTVYNMENAKRPWSNQAQLGFENLCI